jgi:hypothetical protein
MRMVSQVTLFLNLNLFGPTLQISGAVFRVRWICLVLSYSFNESVVFSMGANPYPEDCLLGAWSIHADRSIMQSRSDRPCLADLLEVERRMMGVSFEKAEILVSHSLYIWRKSSVV